MGDYPEHEKLAAQRAEHEAVVDFLNHLENEGLQIMRLIPEEGRMYRNIVEYDAVRFDEVIASHFEVDQAELEREKRQMLESLRA